MKSLFFMFFLILSISAQCNLFEKNDSIIVPDSLLNYNRLINSAELDICDLKFLAGLNLYDSAFKWKSNPFAIDQYNASICALMTNQYSKGIKYLENIVKEGFDYHLLDRRTFTQYISNSDFDKLIKHLAKVEVVYNNNLKSEYDSLFEIDQRFRRIPKYYIINRDTLCYLNYQNGLSLKKLIAMNGFPSEWQIGIPPDLISPLAWELIVIHNRPNVCQNRIDFGQIIELAYLQGNINRYKAAKYIEENSEGIELFGISISGLVQIRLEQDSTKSDSVAKKSDYGYFNLSSKNINKFNNYRKTYGIESIQDMRKKISFQLHNEIFKMINIESIYSFSTVEDYQNFKKNLFFIE